MKYGIVCGGEVEEAGGESQGNEVYSCVSMCYYLAPYHLAHVSKIHTNFSGVTYR